MRTKVLGLGSGGWRRREASGGFCLLDVVLATALLTVVALATTLVLVPMARQTRIRGEVQAADTAARRVLETFQAAAFKDIVSTYPPSVELDVPDLPDGKIRVTYDDPTADPLLIHVELSWNSPDLGSMSRTFSTLRTE
jgi:type II secretory pathway pseudopilin PulG